MDWRKGASRPVRAASISASSAERRLRAVRQRMRIDFGIAASAEADWDL